MIPIADINPTQKRPVVTYFLILINLVVFLGEIFTPDLEQFFDQFALISTKVDFSTPASLLPFLTFQFLHAGFFHFIANMWFLKIFGDNVEEELGHGRFFIFYLFSGVMAGFSQYLFSLHSSIPMIGASGSIAGVLGAYFVFFPHHQIKTLIPGPLFWYKVNLPAALVLFYWFVIQLFSGLVNLSSFSLGGVAFFAHAGGFLTGWLIARLIKKRDENRYYF